MPSKTYDALINDIPELYQAAYGKSGTIALGMRGTARQIELMHNLISNYDGAHVLYKLSPDLSYLSIRPARLHAAIKTFLYCNLLLSKEVKAHSTWDEETGEYTLIQDVETAERLAGEGADAFMAAIPTKSFLPSERSTPSHEYQFAARAA